MKTIDGTRSALLVIDLQARLMPVIHDAEAVIANARRLVAAAALLDVPVTATEQNPKGLGKTVDGLLPVGLAALEKMTFDSCGAPAFLSSLPAERPDLVVAGCEAHVCVLQTVLGLRDAGRRVFVVEDAIGSRRAENRAAAIRRMERHGAEMVTTEMVVFEWLGTAGHPRFREAMALIK